jgi:hypothetical protein
MKFLPFFSVLSFAFCAQAFAFDYDWTGPKDMAASCGDAVVKKLAADKEVGSYLGKDMTVSLEWWDRQKSEVSFTFNFDEDVRDGYMTGNVAVKVKKDGTCKVGKVLRTSIGD